MSSKQARVPQPLKKAEFDIRFGTNQAKRGWQDLLATKRNAIVDAWDFLARNPSEESSTNHRLKGELATVSREGRSHDRWQYELPGGARIWFYIEGQTVHLVDVHTPHPNETK